MSWIPSYRTSAVAATLVAAALAVVHVPRQAEAHQPVEVQILSPERGAKVRSPVELTLRAKALSSQTTSVVLSITVDGNYYDPFTGRIKTTPPDFGGLEMTSGQERTVKLPLSEGSHELQIRYAPHQGEPVEVEVTTSFEVTAIKRGAIPGLSNAGFALVAAAIIIVVTTILIASRRGGRDPGA